MPISPEWIRSGLDIALILFVGIGIVQATRLIRHLAGLRASREEMQRFIHDFNATVLRAETGIRNLKQAAREGGDDLEKLIDKAHLVRDELTFLVESADQLAERLSQTKIRPAAKPPEPEAKAAPEPKPAAPPEEKPAPVTAFPPPRESAAPTGKPSSRAEKELMQALQKLN